LTGIILPVAFAIFVIADRIHDFIASDGIHDFSQQPHRLPLVAGGDLEMVLPGGNHQLLSLDQIMIGDEISINLPTAISDSGYFQPRILFDNCEGFAI